MSINPIGWLFRLVGYVIMLFSFTKLNKYNRSFNFPAYAAVALIAVSAVESFMGIQEILYNSLTISDLLISMEILKTVNMVDDAITLVFNALLIYAVRSIAKETEVDSVAYSAARNFFVIALYYVLCAIGYLPFDFVDTYKLYFSMPIYLLYFVWIILMLVLIFKCYAKICDEADEDMPLRKSRFEFVNKFREETARREQKAVDEVQEYAKNKLEDRQNRRKRKR
jgi:hypothetical protein